MTVARSGLGDLSWLTDNLGDWIGSGIDIIGRRYGTPPPGTVITGPNGQIIRQGTGYPVTTGGAYTPPYGGNTYPVTAQAGGNYTGLLILGLGAVALFALAKK